MIRYEPKMDDKRLCDKLDGEPAPLRVIISMGVGFLPIFNFRCEPPEVDDADDNG